MIAVRDRLRSWSVLVPLWAVSHGLFFAATPIYAPPDTNSYEWIAKSLSGQNPWPDYPFHFPPGYGMVLVPLKAWFGEESDVAAVLLQHVAVLAAALMLADVGNIANLRRVGNLAAIVTILNPCLMFWSQLLYTEILTAFCFASALWAAALAGDAVDVRARSCWAIAAGLAIALAGLLRQVPFVLAGALAIHFLLATRRRSPAGGLLLAALPILCVATVATGWCLFTWSYSGRFEIASGGGAISTIASSIPIMFSRSNAPPANGCWA